MSKSIVANRYALALFKAAEEKGQVELIREELLEVKKVFQDNPKLAELLEIPRLSTAKKKDILEALFKDANPLIQNALFVMLEKQRLYEILNFVDEFISIANDAAGVADAVVYSTHALTEEEKTGISTAFAAKIGKRSLHIQNVIDESLIGGIRIRIGNRIYDGSLSGKLNRLQKNLIKS